MIISGASLEAKYGFLLFLPYLSGTIFSRPAFWGAAAGYAGCSLTVLALAGAIGGRLRRMRYLLAG